MKKIIVISLIFISTIGPLKAQIYIPDGIIQGISGNSNVGIGNATPDYKLDVDNGGYGSRQIRWRAPGGQYGYTYSDSGGIGISNGDPYSELIYLQTGNKSLNFYTNSVQRAVIDASGNVGIGTTTPDTKLTVNGNIHTKEVKIDLSIPAPDYVFASDYKLKTLQEVENFIKKNNHLPDIPSAAAFKKNGVMLAEMNMGLLKKIEELTLYMIEQKKEIEELKIHNNKILKKEQEGESLKSLMEKFNLLQVEINKLKI